MSLKQHCDLCENQKKSLNDGIICSLNGLKPQFKHTCGNIKFGDVLRKKIETTNIELEIVKSNRNSTYTKFYVSIIIGFILIIIGNSLIKYTFDSVYTFNITYAIIGIGISFLGIGYKGLNKYRKKIKIVELKKDNLDELLKQYNVKYETNIKFTEKLYGIQKVVVDLKINNKIEENSITTYKINDV